MPIFHGYWISIDEVRMLWDIWGGAEISGMTQAVGCYLFNLNRKTVLFFRLLIASHINYAPTAAPSYRSSVHVYVCVW